MHNDIAIKRYDPPGEEYPFTVEGLLPNGEVVWRAVVKGPQRLYVPPLARIYRQPITIRTRWADGTVDVEKPPSHAPGLDTEESGFRGPQR